MILPDFVIAGTARSGTTSLYYYLKQHPEIGFPSIKEPKYFSSLHQQYPHNGPGDRTVDLGVVRNFEAYQRLFSGLEKYKRVGEASSDYLFFHSNSAQKIRYALGDVRIIICLRDPVSRAYSAYNNLIRDQREMLSFREALAAEEDRLAANWDWMWAYKSAGLYFNQVATFMELFSRVKIVLFDDIERDAQGAVRDVFDFLGVETDVAIDTTTRYSHSGRAKNRAIAFFANRNNPAAFAFRKVALKLLPRAYLERAAEHAFEQEGMGQDIENELRDYFRSNVAALEGIIGRPLDSWK